MRKSVAAMLVLVFLTASCIQVAKPAFSSTGTAENTWTQKAPMQEARANFGIAVVNGKIYAFGGDNGDNMGNAAPPTVITADTVNTNEEYDPATDTWTFKKPMPTARALLGIAVYQNKVYCIGGYYGRETADETEYFNTNANEVYDPATDTWENRTSLPTPRFSTATNIVNGKIYVIGGDTMTDLGIGEAFNVNEVYDPETDSWETKSPAPFTVSCSASAVVDNKICVLGDDPSASWQKVILIYDPSSDSWSIGETSPASYAATAGATTGVEAPKRIYFFDETETNVYDPESDTWTVGASMLSPRVLARVAVINDICYVIGGRSGQAGYITIMHPSAVNEQYTPFGYGTVVVPFPLVPVAVASAVAVAVASVGLLVYFRKRKRGSL
jgi:N-acetylneuraminic acid mutarotase